MTKNQKQKLSLSEPVPALRREFNIGKTHLSRHSEATPQSPPRLPIVILSEPEVERSEIRRRRTEGSRTQRYEQPQHNKQNPKTQSQG